MAKNLRRLREKHLRLAPGEVGLGGVVARWACGGGDSLLAWAACAGGDTAVTGAPDTRTRSARAPDTAPHHGPSSDGRQPLDGLQKKS